MWDTRNTPDEAPVEAPRPRSLSAFEYGYRLKRNAFLRRLAWRLFIVSQVCVLLLFLRLVVQWP